MIVIPALWVGIFFYMGACSIGAASELGLQLFEEGDWAGCRRECTRLLLQNPDNEEARLFSALSELRQPDRAENAVPVLTQLSDEAEATHIRQLAAYELGRYWASVGRVESAWPLLRDVFLATEDRELFLRSGATLENLAWRNKELAQQDELMQLQLRSCHMLWAGDLQRSCRINAATAKSSWGAKPGQWIVSFYRSQISPAIGARCSLMPSCSEYFRLASKKHGLLGVPILADRLVREPGVVQEAADPIIDAHGHQRYRDPLEAHDFWMGGK